MCKFWSPAPCFVSNARSISLHFPLCFQLVLAWRHSRHSKNRPQKWVLVMLCKLFRPTVCYHQSRASDDSVWVHDRAPGATRTVTQHSSSNASLSSKLMVTNLHYEITPRDLTVCPDALLPCSHCHDIYAIWRQFLGKLARSCVSHSSGYESPTTITSRCCRRRENPQPSRSSIPGFCYVDAPAFLPFSTLSFCTCFGTLV
jgi:hypothetical protein